MRMLTIMLIVYSQKKARGQMYSTFT